MTIDRGMTTGRKRRWRLDRQLTIGALLLASPTLGEVVPPPSPPAAETQLVGGADFISPAGEPFHSPDKVSGAERWFGQADADHDGRLTLAEFRADGLRFFKSLDLDHDGEIGSTEIDHYETDIVPEIHVVTTGDTPEPSDDSSQPAGPPYPDRLGAGRYSYIDLPEPITSMDTNFDGGISAKEFAQALDRRFAALDINGDGALTRDELPKLKADNDQRKRRRHGRN